MENTVEMKQPFWINHSGLVDEPDCKPPEDKQLVKESLKNAFISVKVALSCAKKLKGYLKEKHPSIDEESFGYERPFFFLKHPEAELDSLRSITNIHIAYNCIQRHAVALEQMIADAKCDREYYSYLKDKERCMVSVLSSLYQLIKLLHLPQVRDVTRDAMPDELKNSRSSREMKDVIVVKYYMDVIERLYNILK